MKNTTKNSAQSLNSFRNGATIILIPDKTKKGKKSGNLTFKIKASLEDLIKWIGPYYTECILKKELRTHARYILKTFLKEFNEPEFLILFNSYMKSDSLIKDLRKERDDLLLKMANKESFDINRLNELTILIQHKTK